MREIKTKYGPGRIASSADKSHIIHRPVTKSSILSSEDNPSVELDIKTSGHGLRRGLRGALHRHREIVRQAGRRLLRRGMVRLLLSSSFCHRGTIYLTRHDLGELTSRLPRGAAACLPSLVSLARIRRKRSVNVGPAWVLVRLERAMSVGGGFHAHGDESQ